jgi:hypothetical protein
MADREIFAQYLRMAETYESLAAAVVIGAVGYRAAEMR